MGDFVFAIIMFGTGTWVGGMVADLEIAQECYKDQTFTVGKDAFDCIHVKPKAKE